MSLLPYALRAQVRPVEQRTANGVLEGVVSADGKVRTFKGIPYAAPPVGALRWKAPQPAPAWTGVRKASEYGARCMQAPIYSDMIFHDSGPSEDCLYLNLWMPAAPVQPKLPVMVWIYGGGFAAGATSEPRQDGGNLSKKGVLVVSMNYRLGIFGFFSHPALAKESGHNAAGNYGLLDQMAALQWVKDNIAVFSGDPDNVTIFGESAGSFSVSALMASPLAQGLFRRAIGESGAFFGDTLRAQTRAETEKANVEFVKSALGTDDLEALRAKPAAEVLQAASKPAGLRFVPNIDGYFLPESVEAVFAAGKQSHVPLLAGWNADEGSYRMIFGNTEPTAENFLASARKLYGANAEGILKVYPAGTAAQTKRSAQDLAGDRFIGYSTWKWMEQHLKTGKAPVFRYRFEQTLPLLADAGPGAEATAPHASEIEFVFQVLSSKKLPWRPEDRRVSELMGSYWSNFAKTGDPNGEGLPRWPAYSQDGYEVMHLSAGPRAVPDEHRGRYQLLDGIR
ncbi:MAG: carboxylesterase family protein [Candidatus Solibacter sp.]|nr:carboxylesterase family protein [Candidatus Solibacter sp.]